MRTAPHARPAWFASLVVTFGLGLMPGCRGQDPARPAERETDAVAPSEAAAPLAEPTSESVGGIHLGTSSAEVLAIVGEPATRGEIIEWAATGDRVSEWSWPDRGLELDMAEHEGGMSVLSISIQAPSDLRTSRGVGIGTPWSEVDRIYGPYKGQGMTEEEGPEPQWDHASIIVGSVYGGTFFTFEGEKVSSIFIGAGAE